MIPTALSTHRELASRTADGIDVVLPWQPGNDDVLLRVDATPVRLTVSESRPLVAELGDHVVEHGQRRPPLDARSGRA